MELRDLVVVVPSRQIVYVGAPDKIYMGEKSKVDSDLLSRRVTCMYSAYNEKENIPVLIIDVN